MRQSPTRLSPVVRLGRLESIGIAGAEARRALLRSWRGPGIDQSEIPLREFIVGGGRPGARLAGQPRVDQYTSVQNSSVPTLLIRRATRLGARRPRTPQGTVPGAYSNGHQVILSGLGHTDDSFPTSRAPARQLFTTFYATGQVDASRYTPNVVQLHQHGHRRQGCRGHPCGTIVGFVLFAVIWLRRVRDVRFSSPRRYRPQTGAWISFGRSDRVGLGGWSLGALLVLRFWPARSRPLDPLLTVVSVAVPIWLGVYAGWVRTDTPKAMQAKGVGAAGVGAVVGAALGFHAARGRMAWITSLIGAAAVSNLSLLVLDIWTEQAASRGTAAPAVDPSETEHLRTEHLEPALH